MSLVSRHRGAAATVGGAVLALLVFVVVWFQPQKLFIDVRVDEDLPSVEAMSMQTGAPPAASQTLEGTLRPLAHPSSGRAVVTESDGARTLGLRDFRTENGPDLVVYLSSAEPGVEDDDEFARDFVDLGQLKGNVGNQSYAIPADTDLGRYRTVVIWCRRFNVAFAAAPLA